MDGGGAGENPLRRGMVRLPANGHALEFADGTPYLVIGDTWYALASNRFKWYDDDRERARSVRRPASRTTCATARQQGFNWVNVIAAFPNWKTDGKPWHLVMNDPASTTVRSAWLEFGTGSAKNMDNEGGRPFFFPGKVPGFEEVFPDMDRINPEYFQYLDRKIDYLNANGIRPVHRGLAARLGPVLAASTTRGPSRTRASSSMSGRAIRRTTPCSAQCTSTSSARR